MLMEYLSWKESFRWDVTCVGVRKAKGKVREYLFHLLKEDEIAEKETTT